MKIIDKIKRYFRKHADQRFVIHVVSSDGTHRLLKWSEFNLPKVGTGLTTHGKMDEAGASLYPDSPVLNYFDAELLAFRLNRMRSRSFVHAFSYTTHRIH